MRALTIRQPWAWLIVNGHKDVENRSWNTLMRGRFLIHAAKGITRRQCEQAYDFAHGVGGSDLADRIPQLWEDLECGGIVGVATLDDVIAPTDDLTSRSNPWHMEEQFGFRLRDVRPLPFLPCAGALGFWGNFEIRDGHAVRLTTRA